jgi:hypothetical protein
MLSSFLSHTNFWSILVATLAYFALGSLWYSVLFGKAWVAEVEKSGVKLKEPGQQSMAPKMIQTLLLNFLSAFCIAYLVYVSGISNWLAGFKLGLLCGVGFAAAGIVTAFTWESRSFKLVAIDSGYPIFGMCICGIILSLWH